MSYAIAIDGPAGAGKSSIARRMAEILDIIYVDTGALYRVIGLAVYREAGMCQDPETISRIADHVDVSLSHNEKGQRVFLGEEDVSEGISGRGGCLRGDPQGGDQPDGLHRISSSVCTRKTAFSAARHGKESECRDGRQGYRNQNSS